MEKFWMVWNERSNAPAVKHDTLGKAKAEAERLACLNTGKNFVVLESLEVCSVKNPIKWEETNDIPF
jgi:hypothetical protein